MRMVTAWCEGNSDPAVGQPVQSASLSWDGVKTSIYKHGRGVLHLSSSLCLSVVGVSPGGGGPLSLSQSPQQCSIIDSPLHALPAPCPQTLRSNSCPLCTVSNETTNLRRLTKTQHKSGLEDCRAGTAFKGAQGRDGEQVSVQWRGGEVEGWRKKGVNKHDEFRKVAEVNQWRN
ncbi:hypothetical protein AAFF_G00092530 [Aldrovandia affinis]|uniref:Uncharacterized protein n=1 Tax=Aldrovandia affinis TaxID=143900 RepID=A0AAD7T3S2_9TELE|nr:hypothetical protein AAFF_G00092530 [Aldrovandia affinis]